MWHNRWHGAAFRRVASRSELGANIGASCPTACGAGTDRSSRSRPMSQASHHVTSPRSRPSRVHKRPRVGDAGRCGSIADPEGLVDQAPGAGARTRSASRTGTPMRANWPTACRARLLVSILGNRSVFSSFVIDAGQMFHVRVRRHPCHREHRCASRPNSSSPSGMNGPRIFPCTPHSVRCRTRCSATPTGCRPRLSPRSRARPEPLHRRGGQGCRP